MKKITLLFLMTILFASAFLGCGKHIEENLVSDFEYIENEDGGITITKYIGERTEVVIPDEINGKKVTVIGSKSFMLGTEDNPIESPITYVDIPDSVTAIEELAFFYCKNLESVIFPENLESVGYSAFAWCSALKEIRILASVKYGNTVFARSGIESLKIEEGTTVIEIGSFIGTNLKKLNLPKTVEVIKGFAFHDCTKLNTVILNDGLKHIEAEAFNGCINLKELIIPKSVTKLHEYAFYGCYNLTKLKFSGNAPEVSHSMNIGSDKLIVYYHEGAEGFTSPEWNGYPTEIW